MKNALILFKRTCFLQDAENIKEVAQVFSKGDIDFDTVEMLSLDDDLGFKRRLADLRNTVDNLVVTVPENLEFDIKDIISKELDISMVENDNAISFIEELKAITGKTYDGNFAIMPSDSIVIPNTKGGLQGFMYEDKEFTLCFLPQDVLELKGMCEGYIVPYMDTKYKIKKERFTFKYFGDTLQLNDTLNRAKSLGIKFTSSVFTKYGDSKVDITVDVNTSQDVKELKKFIFIEQGKNIYAESEVSLGERVFDLLKLREKKISVAESFTGGRVVSSIIQNPGASSYVYEGVVSYSNDSKAIRLNVNRDDLHIGGAVSSKVAYQMALGLLSTNKCDIAVATTGLAGPKSDDSSKPVGLNYIAVGMKNGIHVYKYELKGDREEITETAKNNALFLIIKTLKNI